MTEDEWLTCDHPGFMLDALYDPVRVSYRKLRLFACACCRLIPGFWDSAPDREQIEFAELDADGLIDPDTPFPDEEMWDIRWYRRDEWNSATRAIASHRDELWDRHKLHDKPEDERARILEEGEMALANLLREVLGNPFRPVSVDPAWLTSTVVTLANGIYEQRAFDRMPILADALQDAGCENADILDHCRGSGPHVRGCWVVDLLLGKS